ncbi:MAG TPA: biliverdin-producing heme oxygenase [Polyangiaceae bacterium]|nr:biliverdin-producing heme oxygenase [Polyangiaceae bacterium]
MDILTELRSATAAVHRRLELDLALLGPGLTRSRYEAFVCGMAGMILPFESSWDEIPGWGRVLPDYESRRKAGLLLADIQRFQPAPQSPLPLAPGFVAQDCETALGVGYVLEGSTLGGAVIAREVLQRLGPHCPAAYLQCYGSGVGTKWKGFCSALEQHCGDAASALTPSERAARAERVVLNAVQTFDRARDWLNRDEALSA